MSWSSYSVHNSVLGLFGGDFGLPPGVTFLEPANDTTRDDWFDSRCASRNSLKYSSWDVNGSGAGYCRSGLLKACDDNSIQESKNRKKNYKFNKKYWCIGIFLWRNLNYYILNAFCLQKDFYFNIGRMPKCKFQF